MAIHEFSELQGRVFDLYNAEDFAEALAELNRHSAHFPLHQDTITLWKACLANRTGQASLARWFLEEGIAAGEWWAPQILLRDPDLATLRDDSEFQRLVSLCAEQQRLTEHNAMPMRLISEPHAPPPWPALMTLDSGVTHARNWKAAVSAGWLLTAPQSTQASGANRFGWVDHARSVEEVHQHLEQLSSGARTNLDRVVLASFSSSAVLALEMPAMSPISIRGVIAIAPRLDPSDNSIDRIAQRLASSGANLAMVAGRRDLYRAEGVEIFINAFEKAGGSCYSIIRDSLTHEFPSDFDELLPKLLEFIERPA